MKQLPGRQLLCGITVGFRLPIHEADMQNDSSPLVRTVLQETPTDDFEDLRVDLGTNMKNMKANHKHLSFFRG